MEVKEALEKRRSIRKFKDTPISDEIIKELMIAAMSGPSAVNKRPWEFYVITNKEKLNELKSCVPFGKYDAPLAIVVCGNLLRSLPFHASSYWIQDCSAATENILLRVTDLGLGAVWCGGHPQKLVEKNLRKCLSIPKTQIPLNVIYIGYPSQEVESRSQYEENRIHYFK